MWISGMEPLASSVQGYALPSELQPQPHPQSFRSNSAVRKAVSDLLIVQEICQYPMKSDESWLWGLLEILARVQKPEDPLESVIK